MKRLLATLALLSLLTACGGGRSREVACEQEYWDGTYGTCLPSGWILVDRETLRQRGVPEDVIVAFQAETSVSGQFPTVTVTRERLTQETDPEDYSEASIRSVSVLPDYELLDSREVTVDEVRISLHVFTAKPVTQEPMRRFYQVSTTFGGVGYTITGSAPVSVSDATAKEITLILTNSTFVGAVEEE